MTSREKVLSVYPDATVWAGEPYRSKYRVMPMPNDDPEGTYRPPLGFGNTAGSAWDDAAKRLPSAPSPAGETLGTCADFPNTPHAKGTCESCDMWTPVAAPIAPAAVSDVINFWVVIVSGSRIWCGFNKDECEEVAQKNAGTVVLYVAKPSAEKDTRIAELEKNIAKRKAAGETTTRLFMQLQARAEAAEAQLAEKGARISELEKANAKIPKMYVWGTGRQGFYATAQAYSVAEARELLLEETGTTDGSCPIRALAVEAVRNENPTIFYRSNAQFTLTDSAELEEMDAHAETLRKRAEEAEAQLRAVSDALEEILKTATQFAYNPQLDNAVARIRAIVEGK